MKNNKGITLVSLVIYIAVVMVVTAAIIRITTYFKNNMTDVADVSFETEFQKINLYLLDESKKTGNGIDDIIGDTKIIFINGNSYEYKQLDKIIYLNNTIKVCENVESCTFSQKTAENGKSVIVLEIKISGTTKTVEYVMVGGQQENNEININDYLWGGSLVSYYLKAGDYVDYIPDTGTYKVADGQYGSGYTTEQGYQSFTTETGENALNWRVLSIDEKTGEIELISETVAQVDTPLYLQGVNGYNHGVDILNDLCENLYSKTVNGTKIAIARSINIQDINEKTTFLPEQYTNYNKEYKYSNYSEENRKYPSLYAKENGFYIGGVKQAEGINESMGLKDGVVTDGITEYKTVLGYIDDNDSVTTKDVSVTYTYYNYTPESDTYLNTKLGINIAPKGLIDVGPFWLASRCVSLYLDVPHFMIRILNSSGRIGNAGLFGAGGIIGAPSYAVRPVVSLSGEHLDFSIGDGSEENPWGMK